jgi:uncharacterized membrane protein
MKPLLISDGRCTFSVPVATHKKQTKNKTKQKKNKLIRRYEYILMLCFSISMVYVVKAYRLI